MLTHLSIITHSAHISPLVSLCPISSIASPMPIDSYVKWHLICYHSISHTYKTIYYYNVLPPLIQLPYCIIKLYNIIIYMLLLYIYNSLFWLKILKIQLAYTTHQFYRSLYNGLGGGNS